jgi:glycosyltransferase involved in cell wall biosynthesis
MTTTRPLLVVVPAFNEEASIAEVVNQLLADNYQVLVVDDGSTDETSRVAQIAGATVLRLPVNLGVGGALRAGFRFAVDHGYRAVVQVDADGQHPVHQIHDLESAAQTYAAHLVIGSRFLSSDTTLHPSSARQFAMRLLSWLTSRAAGRTITDSTSGFRIVCEPLLSEFAREFPSYYLGDTFEATISAARAGHLVIEVPAALTPRQHGQSTVSVMRAVALVAKVIVVVALRMHPVATPLSDHQAY